MLREVKHLWGICGDKYGFGSHSRILWEFPKCHVVVHALCLWMTPLSIDDLPECLAFGSRTTLMDELEMNNFCYPSLFIFLHFQSHLLILLNLIIWTEHLLLALKNMLKDVRKWKKKSSCWSMHASCVIQSFTRCMQYVFLEDPIYQKASNAESICSKQFKEHKKIILFGDCLFQWNEQDFKKRWDFIVTSG